MANSFGSAAEDNTFHMGRLLAGLIDAADQNDWEASFTIDLAASRTENRVVFRFDGVQPIYSL